MAHGLAFLTLPKEKMPTVKWTHYPNASGGETAQTCFPAALSLRWKHANFHAAGGKRSPCDGSTPASTLLEESLPKPECSKHPSSMRHHKYVGKTRLEV